VNRDPQSEQDDYRLHRRFDRLGRMFGDPAVHALMQLRVAVFGLGGVGCFAAEALVRSAVGYLLLVDFDDVCITNSNRQLQALEGNIGKPKAWVLRDRMLLINPQAKVEGRRAFYNQKRSEALLTPPWPRQDRLDFVVDCIDNFTAKAHLIATCKQSAIPIVCAMGAAGKVDPTRIRIADLADAFGCPMARELRKILRTRHGFAARGPMGVTVVFSSEKRHWPRELTYDRGKGFRCVCGNKSDEHSCETRAIIDGTTAYVTGAFGLACASVVVNQVALPLVEQSKPGVAQKQRKGKDSEQDEPHP
jgi:tRNA threonylcarbamoyladenosine dehydratase